MRTPCFSLALILVSTILSAVPVLAEHGKTSEERIETLSTRIEEIENHQAKGRSFPDWIEKIDISGLIEAEAGYRKFEPAASGESDEESSDILLSTMEFGLDVDVNEFIGGHLLFLWEEDSTEPVDLDEAFITVSGGKRFPVYVNVGRLYLPFISYESYFISDPVTLDLGETRESAIMFGCATDRFDLSALVFNGDVDEIGKDDNIDGYFASAAVTLPDNALPGVGFRAGVSFTSSLAESFLLAEDNDLNADGDTDGLTDFVPGISGYVTANYLERLFLIAEYVEAMDEFDENEMLLVGGRRPSAWNTELTCVFPSGCGFGIKYEATDDVGELLPESRYGGIAFCHPFENAYLGLEYLREEFENGDDGSAVTAQLAYQF